jgi:hypothetical protein
MLGKVKLRFGGHGVSVQRSPAFEAGIGSLPVPKTFYKAFYIVPDRKRQDIETSIKTRTKNQG